MKGEEDLGGERRREEEREFKQEVGKGGINVKDGLSFGAACDTRRKQASEKNAYEDSVTARIFFFLEVKVRLLFNFF